MCDGQEHKRVKILKLEGKRSSGWNNKYADKDNIKDGRRNGSTSLLSIKTRPNQHVTWAEGDDKKPSQAFLGPVSYL